MCKRLCLLILYYNFGAVIEHSVSPKWACVAFDGYAAAVEVIFCVASWAGRVPGSVVNLHSTAGKVALGAGPVVCPQGTVTH